MKYFLSKNFRTTVYNSHQLFRLIEVQELTYNFKQWYPARTLKDSMHA